MTSFDRLTVKATEAIQAAVKDARTRETAEIYGVHLLEALLGQEEGIVTPILQKIGVQVHGVHAKVREEIDGLARVSGGSEPRLNRDLNKALDAAEEHARSLEDDYVSTEHLLLGLTGEKADAGEILRDGGATTYRPAVCRSSPGRNPLRAGRSPRR